MESSVYCHSGKTNVSAYVIIPAVGVLSAVLFGIIYGYFNVKIIYAGSIMQFVYAVAVGSMVARAAQWGKCRNFNMLKKFSVFFSFFAVYMAWVTHFYVLFKTMNDGTAPFSIAELFFAPKEIGMFIYQLTFERTLTVETLLIPGWIRGILYLIEAVIIYYMVYVNSTERLETEIFCEECENWCTEEHDGHYVVSDDETKDALMSGFSDRVVSLSKPALGQYPRIGFNLISCPHCRQTAAMKLSEIHKDVESNNALILNTPFYVLNSEQYKHVSKLFEDCKNASVAEIQS